MRCWNFSNPCIISSYIKYCDANIFMKMNYLKWNINLKESLYLVYYNFCNIQLAFKILQYAWFNFPKLFLRYTTKFVNLTTKYIFFVARIWYLHEIQYLRLSAIYKTNSSYSKDEDLGTKIFWIAISDLS